MNKILILFFACFMMAALIASSTAGRSSKACVLYGSAAQALSETDTVLASSGSSDRLEISDKQLFDSDSGTDFSVQPKKIRNGGSRLLLLPACAKEAAFLLEQMKTMSMSYTKVLGSDGLDEAVKALGDQERLAESTVHSSSFILGSEESADARYSKAYENISDGAAAYRLTDDASWMREELQNLMKNKIENVTGGISWHDNGSDAAEPRISVIRRGFLTAA